MMGGRRVSSKKMVSDRLALQKRIEERFGEEAIQEARRRLCHHCSFNCPLLLPICSDGKDCPYFQRRENATTNSTTG